MPRPLSAILLQRLLARAPRVHAGLRALRWRLRGGAVPTTDAEDPAAFARYRDALERALPAALPDDVPDGAPWLSVLMPVDAGDPVLIEATLAALARQTALRWELCVVAPADAADAWAGRLTRFSAARVVPIAPGLGALDTGLRETRAPFVAPLPPGALPVPDALARLGAVARAQPDAALIHADDYQLDASGDPHAPRCRTVLDPVRLLREPVVGRFYLAATETVRAAGGFGSGHHDGLRRLAATVPPFRAWHLPVFACAWRGSAPEGEARSRAGLPGMSPPSVSVIVPTRDGMPHLRACIDGVRAELAALAAGGEIIVVDNGSRDPATLAYLESLEEGGTARVMRYPGAFNFAAMNNRAAECARGEALLLLNDDVVPMAPGWLGAMVARLSADHAGAVGALLLHGDGRIQHAGVALGMGGLAAHPGQGLAPGDPRLNRIGIDQPRTVSAVTAACLLTPRDVYSAVGGLDETGLPVAYNDVDYCLKVADRGRRVVWTPDAVLTHHESVSRGAEDSIAKQRRLRKEMQCMRARWGDRLAADPWISPHLDPRTASLAFRVPVDARVCAARPAERR
ncbi:glycosyltransferase family 2 protein [Algiphilus sp.]|uniref:glycosyltransferase family 2 protein n=1 Tax=Algiphilus sp. TaxID=1872431 RepID=UPI0025BBC936|nr:glycosyltransferase [Algiphilus sp.]MCK5768899.1 glycosyltransferase [Algiphilus sp.]